MKILYFHNAVNSSNMANLIQVKAMCKAMSALNNDVTLSLQADGNVDNKVISRDYTYAIDIRKPLVNNKKIDKYINFSAVKKSIQKNNPDIIYLRNPLLLKQIINSKKPIIIELHNNKLHQGYKWLDKYWHHYLIKKAKTDQILKIVCISEALSNYWINRGIPDEKVITAHDGIDYHEFQKPRTKQQARERLQLTFDKQIITYTGRLYKNRKIENIIALAENFKETHFLVVGGPNEQSNAFKQLAESKKLNNITFIGQVPHEQVPDYLYASDILLALWSSEVPTINFCSPLKLFEYMAAERIIVAHGFPSIKEVLQHNHNAIIAEPDSLEDLIIKTGEALELSYPASIAVQARNDVFSMYTWEKRAKQILENIN